MTQNNGYAGKILRVDLSSRSIDLIPTMDYADRFLGGRGIAAKIYWDEVSPDVSPFDAENRLLFMLGPLAGFPGLAGSRWTVCGKSPGATPGHFSYSNLGGAWGAQLKFAGYDGIVIQGKSDKPVYLLIQDGVTEIRDASALWGKGCVEVREVLKGELGSRVAVVACGPAGENMVTFATLLADNDASGSCGFGGVMGSKKLKAIAVRGTGKVAAANPEKLEELRRYIRELKSGIFAFTDKDQLRGNLKKDVCYGCAGGCRRLIRIAEDGTKHKCFCATPIMFTKLAMMCYEDITKMPASEVPLRCNIIIDEYGLDMYTLFPMMFWLFMCQTMGIVTDEGTGIPISKIGSLEFVETLVRKISLREGFGDILARGTINAADSLGSEAKKIMTDSEMFPGLLFPTNDSRLIIYDPRIWLPHALLFATEPTLPIGMLHDISHTLFRWLAWANKTYGTFVSPDGVLWEGSSDWESHVSSDVFRKIAKRFWGSELAADFSTYDGKALAAKKIQDHSYAKETLILCDWIWPILHTASPDYVGDPTVESKVLSAVTGKEVDEEGLDLVGERIFNLQRAILAREGHRGRESDTIPKILHTMPLELAMWNDECLAPGKSGEVISLKGAVVDREKFENMKSEYYQLRGWDGATGLQTRAKLEDLGLEDIAADLKQRGLLA